MVGLLVDAVANREMVSATSERNKCKGRPQTQRRRQVERKVQTRTRTWD